MDRKEEFRKRTKAYASAMIRLYCSLPKAKEEIRVLGKQLLRSGTSVAANYREASRARSNAEFVSRIETCTQEADESDLWLELLHDDCGVRSDVLIALRKETNELISIFVTMAKNVKKQEAQNRAGGHKTGMRAETCLPEADPPSAENLSF